MVGPLAVDLKITPGKPFPQEAAAFYQGNGCGIAGLDIGFQPMELEAAEGITDGQLHPFEHQALARVLGHCIVTQKSTLKGAPNDMVKVDHSDDCPGATEANQVAIVIRDPQSLEVSRERRRGPRRLDPRPMKTTARLHRVDEFIAIRDGWLSEDNS